jgi:hypothetical protein
VRRALLAALLGLAALPAVAAAQGDPLPPATEVSQQVSLNDAAAAGIVGLSAKGGFGGDTVAVDLEGARVRGAPVVATVRIEFLGAMPDGRPWPQSKADEIAAQIEGRLAGSKSSDGTPFRVDVVARVRAGADAESGGTPGWHQIVLADRPRASDASMVSGRAFGPNGEKSGNWGTNESATTFAHETGHLLGIGDRYSARKPDWIGPDGRHVKLPEFRGDRGDMAAMDRWWDSVTRQARALDDRYGRGDVQPGIPRGGENDIMADGTGADHSKPIIPSDVDRLIAGAGVRLRSNPGDVLANKNGDQQNMVVGAPLDMYAPKGGRSHRDGLFAYCVDLHKHAPAAGAVYDVMGTAAGLAAAHPEYAALARVVEEIGRRQLADPALGTSGPLGANDAIWAITDASEPFQEEARAILAAAGVAFDPAAFAGSPHFGNPNAGSPTTAAVTETGVVPATPVDRSGGPTDVGYPLPAARLGYLRLARSVLRARRRGALALRSLQDGSATRYDVALLRKRRGGRTVPVRRATLAQLTIPSGPQVSAIRLPRLAPGGYVLTLTGSGLRTRRLAFRAVTRLRAVSKPKPGRRSGCGGRSCPGRRRP